MQTKNRARGVQSPVNRNALSKSRAEHFDAHRFDYRPPFVRLERKKIAPPARIIAYDFETTSIAPGTPRPLYLTAYGADFHFAAEIEHTRARSAMPHLRDILLTHFLIDDKLDTKFVAWNGNRFDGFFVAAALIDDDRFHIRPYLTRSKSLRGLRITRSEDKDKLRSKGWEFLDGIAMLGLTGVKLEKFLSNFAPDHAKLTGVIDFEREQFNPRNPDHCAYAMRDSVGLYHGMQRAQQIIYETFDQPLTVTMGGACIKIFAAHIPKDVTIEAPTPDLEQTLRDYVVRGGFCFHARPYTGQVWKYDINQAYAAAMRETSLPAGGALHVSGRPPPAAKCFIARITAQNPRNKAPFYYRTSVDGRMRSAFSETVILDTWITSIEYRQLESEGWDIQCVDCWIWFASFNMSDYVDRLEHLRKHCEGGPSGPIGTMIKGVGNNSYGKTLEVLDGITYVFAKECPPDCVPYYGDDTEPLAHVFYKFEDKAQRKNYHQPQLGAFITAHCRMVLRRAILGDPAAWVYADTDCVVFDRDMSSHLDIDPKRYGAWKIEESGAVYSFLAKKVYYEHGGAHRSAKGMHARMLTEADFEAWAAGDPPMQAQTQLVNFLMMIDGAEMYRRQERRGTAIKAPTSAPDRAKPLP